MLHPMNEAGNSRRIYLRISKGAIISKRNGETAKKQPAASKKIVYLVN